MGQEGKGDLVGKESEKNVLWKVSDNEWREGGECRVLTNDLSRETGLMGPSVQPCLASPSLISLSSCAFLLYL